MQNRKIATLLVVFLFLGIYCEKNTNPVSSKQKVKIDYSKIDTIAYSKHVHPLLDEYCVSCHGSQTPAAGLRLDSWEELIKGSHSGEALIPFDAGNSLLIEMMTKLAAAVHPADKGAIVPDSIKIAFLSRWIDEGAKFDNGTVPYENSRNRVLVCNQGAGMVSVIDADARVVIRNINFAGSGSKPHDVAVDPAGNFWYVSLIGENKVQKYNYMTNELIGEVDFDKAGLLAMHPTRDLLYVGHTLSTPNVPQTIGVITRSTMQIQSISLPYTRPHALVSDNAGRYIFSASLVGVNLPSNKIQNLIGVVDTDSDPENLANISTFRTDTTNLIQMTVSPDNSEIYVSSQFTNELYILDLSDPLNVVLEDSVTVGDHPWHPKFTPDGNFIFVGNNKSNTVSLVNTASRTEEIAIGNESGSDGLAQPHGLVISPDGNYVWVSNRNTQVPALYSPRHDFSDNSNPGTVAVINTQTRTIERVIEIEEFPSGIAIHTE